MQEVLVCGSNGNGQLGLSHHDDVSKVERCYRTENEIVDIANGSNHTLILLNNGDVFACGVNKAYFDVSVNTIDQFEKVESEIKFIGAGWDFSVLVNKCDEVIIRNVKGVLNFGKLINDGKDSIICLRSSLNGIIVIYESKRAFCWGDNKKGQLTGDCPGAKVYHEFHELKFDDVPNSHDLQLEDVRMSRYFNVFLMKNIVTNQTVVVMRCKADNYNMVPDLKKYFKCDLTGEVSVNRSLIFSVDNHVTIEDIKVMWSSIHLMIEGKIYSTGSDVYGQLLKINQLQDIRIDYFNTGTEHGVAVDSSRGKVYAWGWGEHGNCGIAKDEEENGQFKELYSCKPQERIVAIYAGYANTWIVVKRE